MRSVLPCKLVNNNTCRRFISVPLAHTIPFQVQIPSNFALSFALDDLGTCVSFLQACASHGNLSKGKEIHTWLIIRGFQASPFAITSLINLYSKCSRPIDALAIFCRAKDPNLFAWNAIVACLGTNGFPEETLALYRQMRGTTSNVNPDKFTYPCVIKAFSDLGECRGVKRIHAEMLKCNLVSDLFVSSALVKCYINMELVEAAERVFDELPERDVVLWNALVNGFAQVGRFRHALEFFQRMGREGVNPSKFTVTGVISVFAASGDYPGGKTIHGLVQKYGYKSHVAVSNALIDMYGKCKAVDEATEIFNAMPERDIFSWNSLLSVLQQCGDDGGTLHLFDQMRRFGVQPDTITISAVFPACAHLAALMHGRVVHGYMIVNGMGRAHDVFMENSVMDMYAKCGNLHQARQVFDGLDGRDVASWNIMIGGYAANGSGLDALGLFSSMLDARVVPDEVTFVGVLSACSHAGLVGPGREILDRMESDYNVVPTVEHYACVVDMLGRAGKLDEAHDLATHMPIGSNPVVWRAYVAACRVHGDTLRAVYAGSRLLEMEPEHCGSYVLLSNVYGSAGRYGDVSVVRSSMRYRNVRKAPGCSWIELGSGMHVFVTGDRIHPESDELYTQLHMLVEQLREFGYAPDVQDGE